MTFHDGIPIEYRNQIVCMDALLYLQTLPDASVPLFLFSPPYNLGNSTGAGMSLYGHYATDAGLAKRGGSGKWANPALADGYEAHDDAMPPAEYRAWQQEVLRECWRCLPDNGAIYYVHKPRIQGGVCQTPLDFNPGLIVRQIIIWARAGGFNWNPTYYCPTHEWIVMFAKPGFRLRDRGASVVGDVWTIPQVGGTWHPAPFPLALAERVIETVRPSYICDPFMGSGTSACAAVRARVGFMGCDKSASYVERARATVSTTQPRAAALIADQECFV